MRGPTLRAHEHAGLHLCEYDAGPTAWALLGLQFFAYPQLVYLRAARSAHPLRAELDNLFLDAVLFGAWAAYLGFPVFYEGRRAAQRRRLLVSLASRVGIRSAPLQGNRLEA